MDNIERFVGLIVLCITFFPMCIIGTAILDLVKGNEILSDESYSGKFVLMINGIVG